MQIKKYLTVITTFFMCLPIISWCQTEKENTKAEIKWNQYKNEIALDCKFLNKDLNLNSIGTNLMYKKRFGEKKFISVTDKKSWRFQIGGFADYPIASKDTFNLNGIYPRLIDNEKIINVRLLAGIEWQKQMGRFQLYYGLDTGVSFYKEDNPIYTYIYYSDGTRDYEGMEKLEAGLPVIGFMGLKYFFHPRFSVAIESSLSLGVFYSKYTTIGYNNLLTEDERFEVSNSTNITFGTNYLRFINAAFHL
jgi:hypothetical protein